MVGFVAKEIGYYHGVEGGESWSEGSRKWKRVFQIPQGGRYRLQLEVSESNSQNNKAIATIYRVPFDTKYPFAFSIILAVLGTLIVVLASVRRPNLWPSDD